MPSDEVISDGLAATPVEAEEADQGLRVLTV